MGRIMSDDEQNATNFDNEKFPSEITDSIDVRIASMLIENPAVTDQDIATKLGVSRQTINRRRNSAPVREFVFSVLSIPQREVRRVTAKALIRLEQFLDDPDPEIRLKATIALVKLTPRLMTDAIEASLLRGSGI